MKFAILSDIHGNYEALTAVLKDLEKRSADAIISLGDNVGYGPDSARVVDELLARGVLSVQGNHERAMFDSLTYEGLNFQAQENNDAVYKSLGATQLAYCRELLPSYVSEGARWVHGFPPDSTSTYVSEVSEELLREALGESSERVIFVGHTHRLGLVVGHGEQIEKQSLEEGSRVLSSAKKYLVNAGSVGQPRAKDKRAQYLIWNSETLELQVCFVVYDAEACAQKIRDLEWPEAFALRLLPPSSPSKPGIK